VPQFLQLDCHRDPAGRGLVQCFASTETEFRNQVKYAFKAPPGKPIPADYGDGFKAFWFFDLYITPMNLRHSFVTNQVILFNRGEGALKDLSPEDARTRLSQWCNSGVAGVGGEDAVDRYSYVALRTDQGAHEDAAFAL